jgi:hypothetical protein
MIHEPLVAFTCEHVVEGAACVDVSVTRECKCTELRTTDSRLVYHSSGTIIAHPVHTHASLVCVCVCVRIDDDMNHACSNHGHNCVRARIEYHSLVAQ